MTRLRTMSIRGEIWNSWMDLEVSSLGVTVGVKEVIEITQVDS